MKKTSFPENSSADVSILTKQILRLYAGVKIDGDATAKNKPAVINNDVEKKDPLKDGNGN